MQQEELNRILDKRGPFEDLKEEANKKAALDKLNLKDDSKSRENFAVVTDILTDIINRVCEKVSKEEKVMVPDYMDIVLDYRDMEIPSYLKLRKCSPKHVEEIDKSDRITLICSSQVSQ